VGRLQPDLSRGGTREGWRAGCLVGCRATRDYGNDDAPKAKKTWTSKKRDKFVDRAAARRQGLDNEFTEVIAVRDEFERRQEGDDAADVEAKRQLLGGDAEHSILVKGRSSPSE
jgi:hypothetical protein